MIEVNNLTTNLVDEEFLKKITKKVLESESTSWRKEKKELSIALVGQGRIRELNKRYRRKNRITDVLSFSYNNSGEIVICLPEVKKNAKKFNLTFEKELAQVLIHGILHLLGYDHEKKEEKAAEKMKKKQTDYLEKFFR